MEVALIVIREKDCEIVQSLLERSSDYLIFQDEEPVGPNAAQELFNSMPEGVHDKDKVLMGILVNHQEEPVGLFDLIKGYPDSKTLSLGLMVLEPSSRGKGIGRKAYMTLEE